MYTSFNTHILGAHLRGGPLARPDHRTDLLHTGVDVRSPSTEPSTLVQYNSRTREKHAEHLITILNIFREKQLYAKLSKCDLWMLEIQFLGHVIFGKGISMDPSKLEAIL